MMPVRPRFSILPAPGWSKRRPQTGSQKRPNPTPRRERQRSHTSQTGLRCSRARPIPRGYYRHDELGGLGGTVGDLAEPPIARMKPLELLRGARHRIFELGLLRAHPDPEVLDRARIDPLLGVVRHRDDHQGLAHREALAPRAESAVDYHHIGLFDQCPVVEELTVEPNPTTALPVRGSRPAHDLDVERPITAIEYDRGAEPRARQHDQHAARRRTRGRGRTALTDARPHAPAVSADLGQEWIETGADHEIGDRSMEQVVGLLDAPELGPH